MGTHKLDELEAQLSSMASGEVVLDRIRPIPKEPREERLLRKAKSVLAAYLRNERTPLSAQGAVQAINSAFSVIRTYTVHDDLLINFTLVPIMHKWVLTAEFKDTIYKLHFDINRVLMTGNVEDL